MSSSYKSQYFHLIWSTKDRTKWITPHIQTRLYKYIGGIIKTNGKMLEIGGMEDHIHLLISLDTIDNFSQFIRDIKAKSSLWIHKTYPELQYFKWQKGYGCFTVSHSSLDKVKTYIKNQKQHHKKFTFEEEYLKFLDSCNIPYKKQYALG